MELPDSPLFRPQAGFFCRKDFPDGFKFGAATSAFQIEGCLKEGNREPCIWDHYSEEKDLYLPYNEDAVCHYKHYKEDVSIIKTLGFDAYRFSISWSRVMRNGNEPNEDGIQFYITLLDELHKNGIESFVTLFHFDTPQALEDKYGSFLNRRIIEDFKNYADLCFGRFGKKVKNWITFNEPITFCMGGYLDYNMAPGEDVNNQATGLQINQNLGGFCPFGRVFFQCRARSGNRMLEACSGEETFDDDTTKRDPSKDPYTVAHHILLAHAEAVKLYREKYQKDQKGQIGITNVTYWCIPYSDLQKDLDATQRAQDFLLGWFMDPLTTGDYPESMRSFVTDDRLPDFTEEESNKLKGSFDFIGLNYYTTRYISDDPYNTGGNYTKDPRATFHTSRNDIPLGENAGLDWFYVYPKGLMDLLIYTDIKYNSPTIYVTENGYGEQDNGSLSFWDAVCDYKRLSFYHDHLAYVNTAIRLGANVKGYFAWSLLDNFEWSFGFTNRFGINYVDYKNGSKRIPKLSARWFKYFLEK